MGKSQPKAPDPAKTAAAQGAWNSFTAQQQQQMNMIDQETPWGNLVYNQIGTTWITDPNGKRVEVPRYSATQTLSPEQQAIFDQTQAAEGNLAGIANEQSKWLGDYLKDPFEFTNQDAENWAWDLASQRILPQQEQNRKELENQLINRGVRPGTSAWDSEMQRLTNANTDQLNQLALTGRSQAFGEQLTQRNQPLNEIIGLLSGTQVQAPNTTFAQTPQSQVAGVDYTGLVNQKYQADMNAYNSQMGALGGLFGAGMGMFRFSDRRLKENIEQVGKTDAGTPVYKFNYIGSPVTHIGYMAQDLLESQPDAVMQDNSGYYRVDYSKGEVMFSSNRYPDAPQSQGNLAEMTPLLMNGGARAAGALGGFGGGNPFMEGFNSAYPSSGSSGYDSRIDISPLISGAIGQGNFARLNTLGGLVSPISGGLY